MTHNISITNHILLPKIEQLSTDEQYWKREILTRALGVSAIFFRAIDVLVNFMIGLTKCAGRCLKIAGVKIISAESVSNTSIQASFKATRYSITNTPFILFALLKSPKKYFESKKHSESKEVDWKLQDHFGHIYIINLDDTPTSNGKFQKRFNRIVADLHKIGCQKFERFKATYGATDLDKSVWQRVDDNSFNLKDGSPELDRQHKGQAGCYMSHYRVIQDAYRKHEKALLDLKNAQTPKEKSDAQARVDEYNTILILEDDNGFGRVNKENPFKPATVSMEGTEQAFKTIMKELPDTWEMFYLNSVECGSDRQGWMKTKSPGYSDNLNRLQYGLLTNAVAVHSRAYPKILKALSKIDDPNQTFRPVDHAYALLHAELQAFTPKKPLTYQAPGDSAITTGVQNEPWDGTWDRGF